METITEKYNLDKYKPKYSSPYWALFEFDNSLKSRWYNKLIQLRCRKHKLTRVTDRNTAAIFDLEMIKNDNKIQEVCREIAVHCEYKLNPWVYGESH